MNEIQALAHQRRVLAQQIHKAKIEVVKWPEGSDEHLAATEKLEKLELNAEAIEADLVEAESVVREAIDEATKSWLSAHQLLSQLRGYPHDPGLVHGALTAAYINRQQKVGGAAYVTPTPISTVAEMLKSDLKQVSIDSEPDHHELVAAEQHRNFVLGHGRLTDKEIEQKRLVEQNTHVIDLTGRAND